MNAGLDGVAGSALIKLFFPGLYVTCGLGVNRQQTDYWQAKSFNEIIHGMNSTQLSRVLTLRAAIEPAPIALSIVPRQPSPWSPDPKKILPFSF